MPQPTEYTGSLSHEDFVRNIAELPEDSTRSLVYADWLDEQGMPTFAFLVRNHVSNPLGSGGPYVYLLDKPETPPFVPVSSAEVTEGKPPLGGTHLVWVSQSMPREQSGKKTHIHYFSNRYDSQDEAQDVIDSLEREGIPYDPRMTSNPLARRVAQPLDPEFTDEFGRPTQNQRVDYADESTVNNLLAQLASPEHAYTRGGAHPEADHTFRGVLADALQETNREHEAQLLREPNTHVVVHNGRVVPGRYRARDLIQAMHALGNEYQDLSDVPLNLLGDIDVGHGSDAYRDEDYHEPPEPPQYGEVNVTHFDPAGYDPLTHAAIHLAHLGNYLADHFSNEAEPYVDWEQANEDPDRMAQLEDFERQLRTAPYEEPDPEAENYARAEAPVAYMTTEDDFHRALDAQPDDHQTRMVLADFLQEHGDPRAEGYRALGALGKHPWLYDPSHTPERNWIWHPGTTSAHLGSVHSNIPNDWFRLIAGAEQADPSYKSFPDDRRATEDAAALAFAQLPHERRAELLGQQSEQLSRYARPTTPMQYAEPRLGFHPDPAHAKTVWQSAVGGGGHMVGTLRPYRSSGGWHWMPDESRDFYYPDAASMWDHVEAASGKVVDWRHLDPDDFHEWAARHAEETWAGKPLDPQHVFQLTNGEEGEPMPEQDWRPNESIPEDFHAMSLYATFAPPNLTGLSPQDAAEAQAQHEFQLRFNPLLDQQRAFEQALDANPLDLQTHGVYADWLRDNFPDDERLNRDARIHQRLFDHGANYHPGYFQTPQQRDELEEGLDWYARYARYSHSEANMTPYADPNAHRSFHEAINASPQDMTARGAYADLLDEEGGHVDEDLPDILREHPGAVWLHHGPEGVIGGPSWNWADIERANQDMGRRGQQEGMYGFFADPEFAHPQGDQISHGAPHTGPGGTYFVTQDRHAQGTLAHAVVAGDDYEPPFTTHHFDPQSGAINIGMSYHDTPEEAHEFANTMANEPPAAVPTPPPPSVSPPPPPPESLKRQPPRPVNLNDLTRPRYARAEQPTLYADYDCGSCLQDLQNQFDRLREWAGHCDLSQAVAPAYCAYDFGEGERDEAELRGRAPEQHGQPWDSDYFAQLGFDNDSASHYGEPSPHKAREILHDGTVHGHPITEKQRRYFGWLSSKGKTDHSAYELDYAAEGMPENPLDHPEALELWQNVIREPHNELAHGVLADWLDEHGYYDEAEDRRLRVANMRVNRERQHGQAPQLPPAQGEIGPGGPIGPVEFNEGDGGASFYGQAEDIANFRQGIANNPLDWQNQQVFADYLEDQGHPDGGFQRQVGESVQRRLATPWQEPEYRHDEGIGLDFLNQPHEHGPLDPFVQPLTAHTHPRRGYDVQVGRFTAADHGHPDPWQWLIEGNERKELPEGTSSITDWSNARREGRWPGTTPVANFVQANELFPAERWFAGVDDPSHLDPALWPHIEAVMRQQHGRGQRLENDASPSMYGPAEEEQGFLHSMAHEPAEATNALVFADWLDEQGRSAEAEVVRGHAARWGTGADLSNLAFPESVGVRRLHGGRFSSHPVGHNWDVRTSVVTPFPSPHPDSNMRLSWDNEFEGPDDANRLAHQLLAQGYEPHLGSYWQHGYTGGLGVHTPHEDRIYDQAGAVHETQRLSRYAAYASPGEPPVRYLDPRRTESLPEDFSRPAQSYANWQQFTQYMNIHAGPEYYASKKRGIPVNQGFLQPDPEQQRREYRRMIVMNHEPLYRLWWEEEGQHLPEGEDVPTDEWVDARAPEIEEAIEELEGPDADYCNYAYRRPPNEIEFDFDFGPDEEEEPEEFPEDNEPQDDDYLVRRWPSQHEVHQNGVRILTFGPDEDPASRLREHADTAQFWPNAWMVSRSGPPEMIEYGCSPSVACLPRHEPAPPGFGAIDTVPGPFWWAEPPDMNWGRPEISMIGYGWQRKPSFGVAPRGARVVGDVQVPPSDMPDNTVNVPVQLPLNLPDYDYDPADVGRVPAYPPREEYAQYAQYASPRRRPPQIPPEWTHVDTMPGDAWWVPGPGYDPAVWGEHGEFGQMPEIPLPYPPTDELPPLNPWDFDLPPMPMPPDQYARVPRDGYGHVSGIMQPIPEHSFETGHFGPRPRRANYELDYGRKKGHPVNPAHDELFEDWHLPPKPRHYSQSGEPVDPMGNEVMPDYYPAEPNYETPLPYGPQQRQRQRLLPGQKPIAPPRGPLAGFRPPPAVTDRAPDETVRQLQREVEMRRNQLAAIQGAPTPQGYAQYAYYPGEPPPEEEPEQEEIPPHPYAPDEVSADDYAAGIIPMQLGGSGPLYRIQHDNSGQGHNWRNRTPHEVPMDVLDEIAAEILNGGNESHDNYIASNGQNYRWLPHESTDYSDDPVDRYWGPAEGLDEYDPFGDRQDYGAVDYGLRDWLAGGFGRTVRGIDTAARGLGTAGNWVGRQAGKAREGADWLGHNPLAGANWLGRKAFGNEQWQQFGEEARGAKRTAADWLRGQHEHWIKPVTDWWNSGAGLEPDDSRISAEDRHDSVGLYPGQASVIRKEEQAAGIMPMPHQNASERLATEAAGRYHPPPIPSRARTNVKPPPLPPGHGMQIPDESWIGEAPPDSAVNWSPEDVELPWGEEYARYAKKNPYGRRFDHPNPATRGHVEIYPTAPGNFGYRSFWNDEMLREGNPGSPPDDFLRGYGGAPSDLPLRGEEAEEEYARYAAYGDGEWNLDDEDYDQDEYNGYARRHL